jgi:hypothetical protein
MRHRVVRRCYDAVEIPRRDVGSVCDILDLFLFFSAGIADAFNIVVENINLI